MFVIAAHGCKDWKDGKTCYLAKDYSCGGYPCWTDDISRADKYDTVEESKNFWDFYKPLFYGRIDDVDNNSIRIQKVDIIYTDVEALEA